MKSTESNRSAKQFAPKAVQRWMVLPIGRGSISIYGENELKALTKYEFTGLEAECVGMRRHYYGAHVR